MKDEAKNKAIEKVVIQAAARAAGLSAEQVSPGQDLLLDLEMDSLSVFELAVDLEEHYGIRIDDEALDEIKTVGDIIRYIADTLAEA